MRFARNRIIFWNAVLLLLLSGCANSRAHQSPPHAGARETSTFITTPTSTVRTYQPNDHDPFQANFIERAPEVTCPPSSRPTVMCFSVTGAGSSIPYGQISFSSFDINFQAPGSVQDPNACEPTTRQGSIYIGGNTALFTSNGTWCVSLVHFVYQVTGGTGTLQHAHGKGSIYIPDPLHNSLEYWTGTLTP